jgi:hypothetical protein
LIHSCKMCAFKSLSQETTVQHTVRCHRYEVNFMACCSFKDCLASYHSWNSFKSHVKRKHKYEDLPVPNNEQEDDGLVQEEIAENHPDNPADNENIHFDGKIHPDYLFLFLLVGFYWLLSTK